MPERKILRHNVFITAIPAGGLFTANIQCPFVPDEVKVKQIAYSHGVYSLHCDALSSTTMALGSFIDPIVSFTGTTFPLNQWANGTYTFQVKTDGVLSGGPDGGTLNVLLEFRKY